MHRFKRVVLKFFSSQGNLFRYSSSFCMLLGLLPGLIIVLRIFQNEILNNPKLVEFLYWYLSKELISAFIEYVLSKDYWGLGLMTECVKKILEYGFFILNLDIITVSHFKENIRSKRVIEKCGFVYEGTLRKSSLLYNGTLKDKCLYSLDKIEFINNN